MADGTSTIRASRVSDHGRSARDKNIDARKKFLNTEMIRAGMRAFQSWDPRASEAEGMVCEVFFAMLRECNKLEMTQFLANRFFKFN